MWRMLLITVATAAGLSLYVANVQAQRLDTDVDEGLITRPSKPTTQPRSQPTTKQTNSSANARTRGDGSKSGSDCRPAGSRRCTTPASR
jgi:hypothetical protein